MRLSAADLQTVALLKWPVIIVGHPSTGYSMRRQLRERSHDLAAGDLPAAVEEAVDLLAAANDVAIFFEEPKRYGERRALAPGYVYFVGAEEGLIKIGFATKVKDRLASLQTGSPVRLMVLATRPGCITQETAYHQQFAAYRVHGEWFERSPAIMSEIESLNARRQR